MDSAFEFPESERMIFRHLADDHRPAMADPMLIERKLQKAARKRELSLESLVAVLRRKPPEVPEGAEVDASLASILRAAEDEVDEAIESLVPIVHEAFGTRAMDRDGVGLTEAEAIANLRAYYVFIYSLKKNTEASPDSSPPTAAGPAPAG